MGKNDVGDSIDIAFKVLGKKLGVDAHNIKNLEVIPYESENKYSAVFYEKDNEVYCTVKGSLEVVKAFCSNINLVDDNMDSKVLEDENEKLAKDGYRVIALANGKVKRQDKYTENDIKNLMFMGMVAFIDPIRKEAVSSINDCRRAGIKVLMITGDHPLTAFSIAKDLKLTNDFDEVTTGVELDKENELDMKKSEEERVEDLDEQPYVSGYNLDVDQLLCNELLLNLPMKVL